MVLSRMIWGGTLLTALIACPLESAGQPAKLAKLDVKGGFRGVKLGSRLSALSKKQFVRTTHGWRFYKRTSDTMKLFGEKLAEVLYGYKMNAKGSDGVLERIVVVLVSTTEDSCHKGSYAAAGRALQARLTRAFGKPTKRWQWPCPYCKKYQGDQRDYVHTLRRLSSLVSVRPRLLSTAIGLLP